MDVVALDEDLCVPSTLVIFDMTAYVPGVLSFDKYSKSHDLYHV